MTYLTSCARLRLGGTVSGSTITGGTVIESGGIALVSWDGLLGSLGRDGTDQKLIGTDGDYRQSGKPYQSRLITLGLIAYDRDATGSLITTRREHLETNLDTLLGLLDGNEETVILERDMADGTTRWIELEALQGASMVRGQIFGTSHSGYQLTQFVKAAYPFWQSETEKTQAVAGAQAIVNAGNARISNMKLSYAGDSILTHVDTGDTLTITGSTVPPVVIDVKARTIVENSVNADNLLGAPDQDYWMRWGAGTINLNVSAATVTVTWRDHWL